MQPSLDALFEKFPNRNRDDLIPMLQEAQNLTGFLSPEAISIISSYLAISENKVYGVATFYDNFWFSPKGRFHLRACNGTACHVCGTNFLLGEIERQLDIKSGETDKDGLFSLDVVSCLGGCALAPVIEINGEFYGNLTQAKLDNLLQTLRDKGTDEN